MDHLPLPRDPCISSFFVPFLLTEQYDDGDFLTYPERSGWNVTERDWPDIICRHGKEVTEEREIGAFLQTWLYFGLLREITGNSINPALFRASGRTRSSSRFSSECLTRIVREWAMKAVAAEYEQDADLVKRLGDDAQYLGNPINTWIENRLHTLEVANHIWEGVGWVCSDKPSALISKICLSIGALGDYLGQTLSTIARDRGVDEQLDREMWLLPEGFCTPITALMQGWCPNRLHGFVNAQSCTAGALWYLANMIPPNVGDDHRRCNSEKCESLQIDPNQYKSKHQSDDCRCIFAGPSAKVLNSIVEGDRIALFSLSNANDADVVDLHNEQDVEDYIAISHVWADGNGNLEQNSLPLCTLREIQRNVNRLEQSRFPKSSTPIWMDTICLPRHPVKVRRQAISRLNDVFSKASGILVIDSYLQRFTGTDLTTLEILARISISGWTARLWTFAEGQLAKRVWVQFRDKAVDLFDITSRWHDELRAQSNQYDPVTDVAYHMASLYSATTLLRQRDIIEEQMQVFEMKAALTSRQTSWSGDEALCLGAVLNFDLSKIQDAKHHGRMAAFWQQFKTVPVEVVFTPVSERLADSGCRWAPQTLLGGTNGELAMMNTNNPFQNAQPSANGLRMDLEGITWYPLDENETAECKRNLIDICRGKAKDYLESRQTPLLRDQSGSWYRYTFTNAWHQSPAEPDFATEQPGLILLVESQIGSTWNQEALFDEIRGLFVTCHQVDEALLSKVHAHCTIHSFSKSEGELFDKILEHAKGLKASFNRETGDAANDTVRSLLSIEAWLRGPQNIRRIRKALAKLADILQLAGGIDAALDIYIEYIRYFYLVGGYYQVRASPEPIGWCVD